MSVQTSHWAVCCLHLVVGSVLFWGQPACRGLTQKLRQLKVAVCLHQWFNLSNMWATERLRGFTLRYKASVRSCELILHFFSIFIQPCSVFSHDTKSRLYITHLVLSLRSHFIDRQSEHCIKKLCLYKEQKKPPKITTMNTSLSLIFILKHRDLNMLHNSGCIWY